MKCLMIETKDQRKFFTPEKNFKQLIEFCKHFKANMSVVKISNGTVLDLDELAPALCDPSFKKQKTEYKVISEAIVFNDPQKKQISKSSSKIQKLIRKKFLMRENVCLKDLKIKYKKLNLSNATLCNYVKKVKEDLSKEGYKFIKIGAGNYRIS